MSNKKIHDDIFDKVQEQVHTECSIMCQKCSKIERKPYKDEYYFIVDLIEKGWSYKHNKVLCNECCK